MVNPQELIQSMRNYFGEHKNVDGTKALVTSYQSMESILSHIMVESHLMTYKLMPAHMSIIIQANAKQ